MFDTGGGGVCACACVCVCVHVGGGLPKEKIKTALFRS